MALVTQHIKRMLRIILPAVASLSLPHFSTLSHKRHDFRRNAIELKKCVQFSAQILPAIFIILEEHINVRKVFT